MELPEEFADLQGLLRLADMFFMEELREEVGRRLAMGITAENYVERSMMAETYRSPDLATACAKYIVNQGEGIDWGAIKEMPRVTAAVAETSTQVMLFLMAAWKYQGPFYSGIRFGRSLELGSLKLSENIVLYCIYNIVA